MKSIKNILWSYGISGDIPIVLITIKTYEDVNIIYDVLKAHEYWRTKGIICDLVIISKEGVRYDHPLWSNISDIISTSYIRNMQNISGGVFILRGENLYKEEYNALKQAASLVFEEGEFKTPNKEIKFDSIKKEFDNKNISYMNILNEDELDFFNGIGGVDEKKNEYVINLTKDNYTPLPWINVLANKSFGTVVTESGGGNTWMINSREFRLTPWNNDPVTDKRGEIIYIRDDETGEVFNPYILPVNFDGKYKVRHGLGYTIYEAAVCGINLILKVFVPREDNVKVSILSLKNTTDKLRKFTIFYYAEPVMSFSSNNKEKFINTKYEDNKIVFSSNYEELFNEKDVAITMSEAIDGFCLDKKIFFGNGSEANPDFLQNENFSNINNYDMPVGCIFKSIELDRNEVKELSFLLGENKWEILRKYSQIEQCDNEFNSVKNYFSEEIMKIKVKTPDKAFNLLVNGFLLYQALVCRIWTRSAFYQSGGAFGYRDQLQDSIPFSYIKPEITKQQILKHASRQFEEGDVLHWWHEEGLRGTRTRFSDDLLWLPFVTAEYILISGDKNILNEEINFVNAEKLKENEDERYLVFKISDKKATLYEHCILAIDYAYKIGENGFMLMGSGDWNDGMNTVGNKGRGESVWLSWFMYKVLTYFVAICRDKDEIERANRYSEYASKIADKLNNNAWDGQWYKRAIFDDGTPLGSIENEECKIDSISQSWSVISGAGEEEKSDKALNSAKEYLIDRENRIIKLLTPSFSKSKLEPGYIKDYPEGIRENGGQYTHAAIWLGIAYAMKKDNEMAYEIFDILNPLTHTRTDIEVKKYKNEPYVMSADIYTNEKHLGRAGWSWYTGAASWMYRFAIEYILGLKKRGNTIILEPIIPSYWNEFELEYRYNKTVYKIQVMNNIKIGEDKLNVDGILKDGNMFELVDDGGIHFVELRM